MTYEQTQRWGLQPWVSDDERRAAYASPEYRSSEFFRAMIAQKEALTTEGGTNVRTGHRQNVAYASDLGTTEDRAALANEFERALEARRQADLEAERREEFESDPANKGKKYHSPTLQAEVEAQRAAREAAAKAERDRMAAALTENLRSQREREAQAEADEAASREAAYRARNGME